MQNVITEDAHTTNATILLNQGANVFEVNDGGSPLISSGVANFNTDPTVTLTGTAPAGSTVTVSGGGSTHPTPPNAPDVTLPQAAIDHMSDKAVLHVPFLPGSLAEVAKPPLGTATANSSGAWSSTMSDLAQSGDARFLTDGANGSNIALLGNYMASSFAMAGCNHGGTIVSREDVESHNPLLAGSQHG
jgi:hypothetical protein